MVTANPAMWNGLRQVLFYLAAVVLARPDSVGQLRVKLMFLYAFRRLLAKFLGKPLRFVSLSHAARFAIYFHHSLMYALLPLGSL